MNNIRETTIIIMDSIEELSLQEGESLKASTLAKLTEEGCAALGL